MLRRYSKTFILMLVAALVYLGDFSIELLAPDVARYIEQDPRLKPLPLILLFFCLAAAVFLFIREHHAPPPTAEGEEGPAFATEADQINRRALLGLVRRHWVEGVLYQSLWNEARLILNLEGRPDAVVRPCDLSLRRAGQPDVAIRTGTSILEVYRHEREELLLLGEPGSGKTTLLLEIAEALLREAEENPALPIPVVFNLSAWRKGHTRLDAWLVQQLNQDYGVPEKTGRRWVEGGALLLLLDGLDEVAAERRAACVEAVNEYRLKHQTVLRPMVVCCRTREYEEIPDLRLGGAVAIQPLSRRQVDEYLRDGGRPLAGLRAVLRDEPALYQELFATPLMLHVAVITYEGQPAAELRRSVSAEERRRRLWDAYVERMFERKQEDEPLYEQARALDWLSWLGSYLTRKDLQKYLIEGMQPDDLSRPWQTFLVRWLPVVCVAGIFLPVFPERGITSTLLLLTFAMLGAYNRDIDLEPIRRFTIRNLRRRWKVILPRTLLAWLAGAGLGTAIFMALGTTFGVSVEVPVIAAVGAIFGVATTGAIITVEYMFEKVVLAETIRPNEGIHFSLKSASFWATAGGVFFAAVFLLIGTVDGRIERGPSVAALYVAGGGLVGLSGGALLYGGRAAFQHYVLRLLLWRSGRFARDITGFLDWAAQRVLVQRVGGGWRFVHRTLQERFAERYEERYPDETR